MVPALSRLCTYALMHLNVCVLRLDLYYRIPTLSHLCTYALMHLHVCVLRLDLYYRIPTLFPPVHLCTYALTCMCITIGPILSDTHAFPHTQLCTNVLILFVRNVFEENKRNNRGFRGISAFRSTVSFLQTAGNYSMKELFFFRLSRMFFSVLWHLYASFLFHQYHQSTN